LLLKYRRSAGVTLESASGRNGSKADIRVRGNNTQSETGV